MVPAAIQDRDTAAATNPSGPPFTRPPISPLSRSRRWSTLRGWGMQVAKRRGMARVRVAVIRKRAAILPRTWSRGPSADLGQKRITHRCDRNQPRLDPSAPIKQGSQGHV